MPAAVSARRARTPRPRSFGGEGLYALWLLAMGGFAAVVLATVTGKISLLVEHSDSMAPALRTGDLLVVEPVRPYEVGPRDIVTFRDPHQRDELVTHRVVNVSRVGDRYSVVTRGDANTVNEQWSIEANGQMGRLAVRVPLAGWPLKWLGHPYARLGVGIGFGLLITILILRGIWRSGPRTPAQQPRAPEHATSRRPPRPVVTPKQRHSPNGSAHPPRARPWWPFGNAYEEENPPWNKPRQVGRSPAYSASPDGRDDC
jgi:signal peptidase I